MGTVFLVGAGPGDMELITVKGLALIEEADVIIYDHLVGRELLAFSKKDAELIYVGKQASQHALPQGEINSLLVRKAKEKGKVVRLKGGDPFIFGRGGEEAGFLFENGIPFEVIPGVSSAIGVPAYAGIPLTHRDHASTVAFVTGHEDDKKSESSIRWGDLARGPDTLVFLMGIKNIKEIRDRLIQGGRDPQTKASVIQWGTLPQQKTVVGTLKDIDTIAAESGITAPGIIVVGEVVGLRDSLKWFENRPLFGKKIAVTRDLNQSPKMTSRLSRRGAQAVNIPTIKITPIDPNPDLAEAIINISTYSFIIFSSVNGVAVFFDSLLDMGKDARALYGIKIIPIGDATASFLKTKGVQPDIVPERFISEGIVDILKTFDIHGKRFLFPRAEEARDIIVEYIHENGGFCHVVSVYTTSLPEETSALPGDLDVVTFTSSSTVNNFVTIYGKNSLKSTLVASIGPITSETLKRHDISVDMEATRYDIPGLVEALEQFFQRHSRDT